MELAICGVLAVAVGVLGVIVFGLACRLEELAGQMDDAAFLPAADRQPAAGEPWKGLRIYRGDGA